jgi:tRNA (guanine-N7-)-methyltransferase
MALTTTTDTSRFRYPPQTVLSATGNLDRIEVDVGCGGGGLLIKLAAKHPRTHFIGIEVATELAHRAAARVESQGLRNVTVINGEAAAYIDKLPAQSVHALHIYFPTPYPNSIGLATQLFDERFGRRAYYVLRAGGILRLITDHQKYHQKVLQVLQRSRDPWQATVWLPIAAGQPPGQLVGTHWEQRIIASQSKIWSHCALK